MTDPRFDRHLGLFGAEGQKKIRVARVVVVGIGGVGSTVGPQLAMLGVGHLGFIEPEEYEETNRNRHYCGEAADTIPGTLKVDIAERMVRRYDPSIVVEKVPHDLRTPAAFDAVKLADYVFGCVDSEGARLILTELCAAYDKPYIDVASDVVPGDPVEYGGRVCCAAGGNGCLYCLGLIDQQEAREDLESPAARRDREKIYGVDRALLGRSGPSVVSVNTVVAGLAVTEFVKLCTGLDSPARLINYDARGPRVSVSRDQPAPDCHFCKSVRGQGADADVERFLHGPAPTR